MEKKLLMGFVGIFMLLVYPKPCSPEQTYYLPVSAIIQNSDTGELNEEQKNLLRQELEIYQASFEPLKQTDLKAWSEKVKELFRKLSQGLTIYNLSQRNPDLKSKVREFTEKTKVDVYILSYVEDAFLNNIFYRLAEARYDVIKKAHVKMKYRFQKNPADSSSKFSVKLELVYDSALVALLKTKLANGYKEYSDLTLEASANKELEKAGIQDIFSDAAAENTALEPTAEDILDKLASANVEAEEEDYLLVNICDSLVKDEKIYYWKKDCVLKVQLLNKDTVNEKEITLTLKMNVTDDKKDQSFSFVIKNFNAWNKLGIDSLHEGKYTLTATVNKKPQKKIFYLRTNKPDYACTKCGRDLTVTLERLESIFPNNKKITSADASLFTKALKTAGFNTCKKQVHFFSQVRCESANFTKFKESAEYSLPRYLVVFYKNCNVKDLFNQSFWDNKTYKKYFFNKVYEFDTLSNQTKYLTKEIKTHKWVPVCVGSIKESKDTIQCPISFSPPSKKQKGSYILVSYSEAQKAEIQERLFSLTYANMLGNGDSSTHDGYNFFGKGAIQLTGKANYKDVSLTANKIYGTNYDWVKNYNEITEKRESIIYSATAFFVFKIKDLNTIDKSNVTQITKLVNGGSNGLNERKEFYNDIIDTDLYDCTISKD
ncbi:MAG: hypothetical protein ACJ75J_11855 [Cytophagaceae bacterium]